MTSAHKSDHSETTSLETLLLHADRELNRTSAVAPPIFQTATFRGLSGDDFAHCAGRATPSGILYALWQPHARPGREGPRDARRSGVGPGDGVRHGRSDFRGVDFRAPRRPCRRTDEPLRRDSQSAS